MGVKKKRTAVEEVLVAHVKGRVGVRCKDDFRLADYVTRLAVLVAEGITDLKEQLVKRPTCLSQTETPWIAIQSCGGQGGIPRT